MALRSGAQVQGHNAACLCKAGLSRCTLLRDGRWGVLALQAWVTNLTCRVTAGWSAVQAMQGCLWAPPTMRCQCATSLTQCWGCPCPDTDWSLDECKDWKAGWLTSAAASSHCWRVQPAPATSAPDTCTEFQQVKKMNMGLDPHWPDSTLTHNHTHQTTPF